MKRRFKVFDNGGETIDRYTVIGRKLFSKRKDGKHDALYLSDDCNLPNGVSMYTEIRPSEVKGKRIKFLDLPEHVQKHVLSDNRI
jgi:hypothetical protein